MNSQKKKKRKKNVRMKNISIFYSLEIIQAILWQTKNTSCSQIMYLWQKLWTPDQCNVFIYLDICMPHFLVQSQIVTNHHFRSIKTKKTKKQNQIYSLQEPQNQVSFAGEFTAPLPCNCLQPWKQAGSQAGFVAPSKLMHRGVHSLMQIANFSAFCSLFALVTTTHMEININKAKCL